MTYTVRIGQSNATKVLRSDVNANLKDLRDVDTSSVVDGSILAYDSSSTKWTATTTLDNVIIDGGSF
jgi:hypothetical protein